MLLSALLAGTLLTVGSMLFVEYRNTIARERQILQTQARVIDDNLRQHLLGIDAALSTIRALPEPMLQAGLSGQLSTQLKAMSDAMPSVRTMMVLDAQGTVVAASRPEILQSDRGQRAYFQLAREQVQLGTLYVSEPFLTALNVYSMNLVRTRVDSSGRFAGLVAVTLDPQYFEVLLRSVLYESGTRSALVHAQGLVFLSVPGSPRSPPQVPALAPDVFAQHRATGQVEGLYTVPLGESGGTHIVAMRETRDAVLRMDQPLVAVVSRPLDMILADWFRLAGFYALLSTALLALALWAMAALQRKQRDVAVLRRLREQAQHEQAQRVQMALDGGELGLWEVDLSTRERTVDARSQRMVGLPPDSPAESMQRWAERIHPDDRSHWNASRDAYLAGQTVAFVVDYRVRHENGSWTWLHSRAKTMTRDATGGGQLLMGTYLDITERKEADGRIARSERLLARMSRVSGTGGWDFDLRTGQSTWSDEMYRIRELDPLVTPAQDVVMNAFEPESRARLQTARQAAIDHRTPWDMELEMVTAKGNRIWVRSQGEPVVENGLTVALTGTLKNVTWRKQSQMELKAANEKLEQLALSDGLTGIANRRHFDQTLKVEWTRSARSRSPLSLLLIDIDHFKRFNDRYGHAAGDDCLRRVAQLLAGCSRRAGDLVSRYGGEEFAILLQSTDMPSALVVAQACLDAVRAARIAHGASATAPHVTISIGVASFKNDGDEPALMLVERADAALYRAKSLGRDQFSVDDPAEAADPVPG